MMREFISFVLISSCSLVHAQKLLLIENWQFKDVENVEWMNAEVPGTVHTDLFSNRIIQDPFHGENEIEQQWIENHDWVYRLEFNLNKSFLKNKNIDLVFEGLDTYASVIINDVEILLADNMFRTWRIDVKKHLKRKDNVVTIIFKSPISQNIEKAQNYLPLPGGVDTSNFAIAPFCRKAAYHFGWDWSPRFVTSGIWKPVYFEAWNDLRIVDFHSEVADLESSVARITCEIQILSSSEQTVIVDLGKYGENEIKLKSGTHTYNFEFQIENPELWWPNGSGAQRLYEIDVEIRDGKLIYDQIKESIGIRKIELVNNEDDIGQSFFFKVNEEPIFMKGANYVPQDVFLPRVKSGDYRKLLGLAKEAGMNMIRVWGGGIYENDIFYDLCDSLGILVWQDFMFAGTMYPSDEDFLKNIESEVQEQVIRLRNHPCIALWCGNNEIEVAWKNWGWQDQYSYSDLDSIELWNGYKAIFTELLPDVINRFHPNSEYVPTSPESNWGTPENFNFGSMHYWGVWHGDDDFDDFELNTGRFMVEYGFQSYPSFEILQEYVPNSQLNIHSDIMIIRQKSYVGNGKILDFIAKYLPNESDDFQDFISSSQKIQALALSKAIRSHIDSYPHCMGTLVWQLNDSWPGPSWSIIQYDGKTKLAYDAVKKLYSE